MADGRPYSKVMREIILIAHNVRSIHNVGSLFRTAEGLGVHKLYLTGYTPYPLKPGDSRLPHLAQKIHKQIQKTALDAEHMLDWEQHDDIFALITELQSQHYTVAAIEQAASSILLPDYVPTEKIALIVGREVEGIETQVLKATDVIIEIPMFGHKESFNVVQAAAMALYHVRFR
jgi:23S rRNA (guanosine2251-2'-O)-methyltransferase